MLNAPALQSFGFGERLVRVIDQSGAAWFVANDVCEALELNNGRQAVSRLDADEVDGVITNDAMGRAQPTNIVSESGMYALVFTSRKPVARKFRKWVTSEVLPALRQNGRYELPEAEREPPPQRNDALDTLDEAKTALAMVREARQIFGRKAAMELWQRLPLPAIADQSNGLADQLDGPVVDRVLDRWLLDRCQFDEGAMTSSSTLYGDYLAWCGANSEVPRSHVTFGKFLSTRGVRGHKSSCMYRCGVRLRTPPD